MIYDVTPYIECMYPRGLAQVEEQWHVEWEDALHKNWTLYSDMKRFYLEGPIAPSTDSELVHVHKEMEAVEIERPDVEMYPFF